MKKQIILGASGALVVAALFLFGRTTEIRKVSPKKHAETAISSFDIEQYIKTAKSKLTSSQVLYLSTLEINVKRGDVHTQQLAGYNNLANFWKDSLHLFEPYAFWLSKAAKLDNSEKNLTFAAQLFLATLRGEHDEAKLNWETTEAISLFEQAIKLDPDNDTLRIGLGSCYVYGKGHNADPQETMKGIRELLTVVRKDSNNMKAQLVLGIGGYVSGQYDKAVERLQKVIDHEPRNIEAIAFLADTYAAKGEKEAAIRWYQVSKRLVNNAAYSREVDERIKLLR